MLLTCVSLTMALTPALEDFGGKMAASLMAKENQNEVVEETKERGIGRKGKKARR